MPKVVITGGGTGGHLYPMLSIADALVKAGVALSDIRLIGSSRGEDQRILASCPYRVSYWPGRGIRRSLSPRDNAANLRALAGISWAFALGIVTAVVWRPSVVVSVGGYASLPMSIGAVLTRRTLVLVELDARAGLAQRLVKRFAAARCTSFADSDPRAVLTGVPLRSGLSLTTEERRQVAKASLLPEISPARKVVLVMTGSLGAKRVNDAVADLAEIWADRTDLALVQITGRRDFARVKAREVRGTLDYRIIEFADMTKFWPIADVAICRAGATTVAELGVVAVPAVLVPLPNSPSDHQNENARALVAEGAARVIDDSKVSGMTLAKMLESILDTTTLGSMAEAMRKRGRPNAAADIAKIVIESSGQ